MLYMSHTVAHEVLGHYLALKLYRIPAVVSIGGGKLLFRFKEFEFRSNVLMSYVEAFGVVKNEFVFYFSAIIVDIILFFITFTFLHQYYFVWIYSALRVISEIIFIEPKSDLYNAFKLNRYIKLTENQEFIWIVTSFVLSFISLAAYIAWFCVRY